MSDLDEQLAEIGAELRGDNTEDVSDSVDSDTVSSDVGGDGGDILEAPEDNAGTEEEISQEDNEQDITTVSGLAEAIGWEAAELYEMQVPMGDGVEPVSLGQLKDKYQEVERTNKTNLSTIEELNAKLATANAPGGQASLSGELLQAQSEVVAIQNQFQGVNWQQIEQDDPGQAALLKQKYNEAFNAAQGKVQQVQNGIQQGQAERLQQGAIKLRELIPAWSDPTAMDTGQKAVRELLHQAGYPDQNIDAMDDPIAISLIDELVQLRAEKAAATKATGKVRAAPRVLKGGGRPAPKQNELADKLAQKARATGNKEDQLNAVKALLMK